MPILFLLFSCIWSLSLQGTAQPQFFSIFGLAQNGSRMLSASPAGETDQAAWSTFLWDDATIGGRKYSRAALLIPVRVPEQRRVGYLQLDLGASTVFYTTPYSEFVPGHSLAASPTFTGRIAGHEVQDYPIRLEDVHRQTGAPADRWVIGTLGMDFFAFHSLVIDFPNRRLLILDYEEVPETHIHDSMMFSEGNYRDDKFFVALSIAGKPYKDGFFFDTGSSLFPLIVSPPLWHTLTGRTGNETANIRMDIDSWEKKVTVVGAPVRGSIEIAGAVYRDQLVFYTPHGEFDFAKADPRIIGLFGNALFYDRMVLVDPYRRRFGVSRQ